MPRTRVSSSTSHLEVRRRRRMIHQSGDSLAGCILWLPKKDVIDQRLLEGTSIDEGCFHHPVVILSTDSVEGDATVLILTSFDGQDLMRKHPNNRSERSRHLPISPCAAHPDNGILLFLEEDLQLRKKTYIKTKVKVILKIASLKPYCRSGKEYKLKQTSFNELTVYITSVPTTAHTPAPVTSQPLLPTIPTTIPYWYSPSQPASQTTQHTPPQIPSAPSRRPVAPVTAFHSQSDRTARYDRRAALPLNDSPLSRKPPPTPPNPDSISLAEKIVLLLLLGGLGGTIYGPHRLLLLAKWALKACKRRLSNLSGIPLLANLVRFAVGNAKRSVYGGMLRCSGLWV